MEEWLETWIDLLTEEKTDKQEEFQEIRSSSPSIQLAIMEYRRLEHEKGRGSDIQSINGVDSLQELFLEPITLQQIDYLHKKLQGLKMDMVAGYNKIYQMHLQNKGNRFLYLINSL